MVVPYEDGVASAAEMRKRAGNKDFAQVFMLSRTGEAAGRKRYWPIYEAAVEAGCRSASTRSATAAGR